MSESLDQAFLAGNPQFVLAPLRIQATPGAQPAYDEIIEDGGRVTVRLPTKGSWPAAGATIDLFMPKRAAAHCPGETVELHATDGAVALWRILVDPRASGHARSR